MVRTLKLFGIVMSIAAGTTSALVTPRTSQSTGISTASIWESSSVVREDARRPMEKNTHQQQGNHWNTLVMMPSSLEREIVRTGGSAGPATLDRPATRKVNEPVKEKKRVGAEEFEVRIYNDGFNTREYVARSLVQVTGMSELAAYQTMMQAHQNGIAAVGRWCYELAEMYHDRLRKNGIVCDIVPVDGE